MSNLSMDWTDCIEHRSNEKIYKSKISIITSGFDLMTNIFECAVFYW